MAHGAVVQHVTNQRGDGVAIGERPQAQEIDATELAAETLANACAGQAEAEAEQARALGDEGLAQEGRDLRRLDLETARRNTAIAYAVPIRVKLPTRWLLHNPPDAKRYTLLTSPHMLGPNQGKSRFGTARAGMLTVC